MGWQGLGAGSSEQGLEILRSPLTATEVKQLQCLGALCFGKNMVPLQSKL